MAGRSSASSIRRCRWKSCSSTSCETAKPVQAGERGKDKNQTSKNRRSKEPNTAWRPFLWFLGSSVLRICYGSRTRHPELLVLALGKSQDGVAAGPDDVGLPV